MSQPPRPLPSIIFWCCVKVTLLTQQKASLLLSTLRSSVPVRRAKADMYLLLSIIWHSGLPAAGATGISGERFALPTASGPVAIWGQAHCHPGRMTITTDQTPTALNTDILDFISSFQRLLCSDTTKILKQGKNSVPYLKGKTETSPGLGRYPSPYHGPARQVTGRRWWRKRSVRQTQ